MDSDGKSLSLFNALAAICTVVSTGYVLCVLMCGTFWQGFFLIQNKTSSLCLSGSCYGKGIPDGAASHVEYTNIAGAQAGAS